MRLFYNICYIIAVIFGLPVILSGAMVSDKRRKTVFKRLGLASVPERIRTSYFQRPAHPTIWVHALSVGEVLSAVSLIRKLKRRFHDKKIIVSVSTKTGYEIAHQHLHDSVDCLFFFPYDLLFSVKYITRRIRPDLVLIVESDIWPNFMAQMKKQGVPVCWVNARISDRSWRSYKRFPLIPKHLFSGFAKIFTQTDDDRCRLIDLGISAERLVTTGNMKFDQPVDSVDYEQLTAVKQKFNIAGRRRIFMAGSTHKGEEAILSEAFSALKQMIPDLLLIVVPRNPERFQSVYRLFESKGFSTVLWTKPARASSSDDPPADVLVVDTMGELRRLYALADIAFIGGSLMPFGGHNPLEPASFSKPVLFGPYMNDFALMAKLLLDSGGAICVKDAREISRTIADLVSDDKKRRQTGENARKVFCANQGAVERTMSAVESALTINSFESGI